jgi:hypothetical protein
MMQKCKNERETTEFMEKYGFGDKLYRKSRNEMNN